MRRLHTLISIAFAAGLGYSQCTGGLFAIPSALAAPTTEEGHGSILMSVEPNICLATVEHEGDDDHAEKRHGGCEEGTACLERAHMQIIQNASVKEVGGAAQEILPSAIALVFDTETSYGTSGRLARAGPLYAFADIAAHVLVKRE